MSVMNHFGFWLILALPFSIQVFFVINIIISNASLPQARCNILWYKNILPRRHTLTLAFFNKHNCEDENDNSPVAHVSSWSGIFIFLFYGIVNRLRQGKLSRLSYFKHNAGGSLQVKIRGEGDGRSDSGPELYGRGNHKEKPLWPKHPSCSCYCNGKRSLTSPADVQPAAYELDCAAHREAEWNSHPLCTYKEIQVQVPPCSFSHLDYNWKVMISWLFRLPRICHQILRILLFARFIESLGWNFLNEAHQQCCPTFNQVEGFSHVVQNYISLDNSNWYI